MIAGEEENFGDDFRSPRVIVREGEEEPASMLGTDGDDANGSAGEAVNDAAAEMDGVIAELSLDDGMGLFDADVFEAEKVAGFLEESCTHFDGRSGGFRVDTASMGNADDQINVAHDLAEDDRGDIFEREGFGFVLLVEEDGVERQSLDIGRAAPASAEIDARGDL